MTTAVAITTRQNVANVLPALQLQVSRYVALESNTAKRRGWGRGARRVLKAHLRGLEFQRQRIPDGPDPLECAKAAIRALDRLPKGEEVFWILGGGLKAQQVGLWMAHQIRRDSGYPDQMVYANPESGALHILELSKDAQTGLSPEVEESFAPLRSTLSIRDIVACNGSAIRVTKSRSRLPKGPRKFEEAVRARLHEILATIDPEQQLFVDIQTNLEFLRGDKQLGEYDVILATSSGTLLALDAKRGVKASHQPQVDWPARRKNFRMAAGEFSQWVVVLPAHHRRKAEELSEIAKVVLLDPCPEDPWPTLEDLFREQASSLRGPMS